MTNRYACPHLSTCNDTKYNKKSCHEHSGLGLERVKAHTLNIRIHGNCQALCPVYKLDDVFEFQKFTHLDTTLGPTRSSRGISSELAPSFRNKKATKAPKVVPSNMEKRLGK
ncbi:hypothetical protein PGT21_036812 [Puccinia graminis f. sp. tritici]|uniref:Uncharacterized protein n=1 Tax=Puccinia graminis f. sp. tritici TaxID=56615 RepID=A0A5B0R7P9_PUCGR|nr:hypothetical protein PGT21_036812 [Puccinia graminis f. sp. tritici]KAA1121512.1 hypothetical protein PGTUg99_030262 [Puccinia graminis f. sp. tritici]